MRGRQCLKETALQADGLAFFAAAAASLMNWKRREYTQYDELKHADPGGANFPLWIQQPPRSSYRSSQAHMAP